MKWNIRILSRKQEIGGKTASNRRDFSRKWLIFGHKTIINIIDIYVYKIWCAPKCTVGLANYRIIINGQEVHGSKVKEKGHNTSSFSCPFCTQTPRSLNPQMHWYSISKEETFFKVPFRVEIIPVIIPQLSQIGKSIKCILKIFWKCSFNQFFTRNKLTQCMGLTPI